MNKRSFTIVLVTLVISSTAWADLPTSKNQQNRTNQMGTQYGNQGQNYGGQYGGQQYPYNYGQGQGAGAGYYNQNMYAQPSAAAATRANSVQRVGESAGDLLWLFTGSDSSIKDQVKNGFHSNSDTSFGGRLFSFFLGAVYKRFGVPLENKLGALEGSFMSKVTGTSTANAQYPYNQAGANYCYGCTQQNPTNPYMRNTQAVDPRLFNQQGTTGAMPTNTPANSVGGIR